jgi:hypothetical protein
MPPSPQRTEASIVLVKIAFAEKDMRQHVKEARGVWNQDKQAWELRYDRALALESVQEVYEGLQSCRDIRRIEARWTKATA